MQPLMFRCPRTGREIAIGIEAQPDALTTLFSLRLRCPACGDLHEWQVGEGLLPAPQIAGINPVESELIAACGTSYDILHDLDMSDDEIADYCRRFDNCGVGSPEHRCGQISEACFNDQHHSKLNMRC
jgi:hypothetical protein